LGFFGGFDWVFWVDLTHEHPYPFYIVIDYQNELQKQEEKKYIIIHGGRHVTLIQVKNHVFPLPFFFLRSVFPLT